MVGPEDALKPLISLTFSWAKIKKLPVLFRTVPRLVMVVPLCSRSMNAQFVLVGFGGTGEERLSIGQNH